jgi:hypothetical protein
MEESTKQGSPQRLQHAQDNTGESNLSDKARFVLTMQLENSAIRA